MASFLRCHLGRFGYGKITSRPETDIVRQCASCAHQIIGDALDACQLHIIRILDLIEINNLLGRSIALQKALDHKLQESILAGKLCSSHCHAGFVNFINGIALIGAGTGKLHHDMILTEPFDQFLKTCIDLENVM